VGLVQREIEAAGFTTVILSTIPDLTAAVSVPRLVGIEYPNGRSLGQPGDSVGQTAVLRATLRAVEAMDTPGSVQYLPYRWPESPKEVRKQSMEAPPIAGYLIRHPWHLRNLLSRNVPD
jgi:D-proline reductase (dithiol) PrdB